MGEGDRSALPAEIASLSGPEARALAARYRVEIERLREDAAQARRRGEWIRDVAFRIGKRLAAWGSL